MAKVEFLIEDASGAWVELDTYGDTPAMVFQLGDAGALTDPKASYSQAVTLPKTPTNDRIFGFADIFEARSVSPYTVYRCAVYVDGVEIIGTSFRLELRGVDNDGYDCQIVSNTIGLFESLKNKGLNDLPNFSAPILWSTASINAGNLPGSYFRFAVAASMDFPKYSAPVFNRFPTSPDPLDTESVAVLATIYPYFDLYELVEEIFAEAGYDLTVHWRDPDHEPVYMSLPNMQVEAGVGAFEWLTKSDSGASVAVATASVFPLPLSVGPLLGQGEPFVFGELDVATIKNEDYPDDVVDSVELQVFQYTAPAVFKGTFTLSTAGNGDSSSARTRYRVRKWQSFGDSGPVEATIISETEAEGVPVGTSWETDEIEFTPGERVYIEAYLQQGVVGVSYRATAALNINEAENVATAESYIYPGISTTFKDQQEVVQLFLRVHGLFVQTDDEAKTVDMYTQNEFLTRVDRGIFVDWSGKLDYAEGASVSFKNGSFAQTNRVLFNANDRIVRTIGPLAGEKYQDIGTFAVDDPTLPLTKDLFTVAAESTIDTPNVDASNTSVTYAETSGRLEAGYSIRRAVWDSDTQQVIRELPVYGLKPKSAKMHLVTLEELGAPLAVADYPGATETDAVMYKAMTFSAQDVIDTYYAPLPSNILNPVRIVEGVFDLSPVDIESLDLMTPVYLDQYGDYFYIQRVNNYEAGQLTKVSLVCLNVTKN